MIDTRPSFACSSSMSLNSSASVNSSVSSYPFSDQAISKKPSKKRRKKPRKCCTADYENNTDIGKRESTYTGIIKRTVTPDVSCASSTCEKDCDLVDLTVQWTKKMAISEYEVNSTEVDYPQHFAKTCSRVDMHQERLSLPKLGSVVTNNVSEVPVRQQNSNDANSDQYLGKLRYINGECPTCGIQTHKIDGSARIALKSQFVLGGRCLLCNPLPTNTVANSSISEVVSRLGFPAVSDSDTTFAPQLSQSNLCIPNQASSPPILESTAHVSQSNSSKPLNIVGKRFMKDGKGGEYTGNINADGDRHGNGVMKWDNGDVYEGEFKNDLIDGQCTYIWANGDMYEGECKNDKLDGQGTYWWPDGSVYRGGYKQGLKNGKGIIRWPDGEIDVNFYQNGECTGDGVQWSSDRQTAWLLRDGEEMNNMSLAKAASVASQIGLSSSKIIG